MHLRHEPLLRWLHRRYPGSRLYGPYYRDGRRWLQWMARGRVVRDHLIPFLDASPLAAIDPHVHHRYERMKEVAGVVAPRTLQAHFDGLGADIQNRITRGMRDAGLDSRSSTETALRWLLAALAAEQDPPTTNAAPGEAVDFHLSDSLSGLQVEALGRAKAIVDIGAGAGFPGLALAAALPAANVDLLEAGSRKCEVIARLALAAALTNATPVAERAETWAAGPGREAYDVATARAVASLPVLVEYAAPLLRIGGVFVAWKGKRDGAEERAGAETAAQLGLKPGEVLKVTPFEGAHSRHLHVFEKTAPTPDRFPRRPGVAARRPLA